MFHSIAAYIILRISGVTCHVMPSDTTNRWDLTTIGIGWLKSDGDFTSHNQIPKRGIGHENFTITATDLKTWESLEIFHRQLVSVAKIGRFYPTIFIPNHRLAIPT